jgi:AraC-like DNA-binding protein
MRNACAKPPGPSAVSGVDLLTVWDVDETPSYDVKRPAPAPPRLIAVRTHSGKGTMHLWNGQAIDLTPGTFMVAENERIARYRCTADRWAFWWFEHRVVGSVPYPLYDLVQCPVQKDEPSLVSQVMTALRHPQAAHRVSASALFLSLATRWSRERPGTDDTSRPDATVQRVVDEMHRRLGDRWHVTGMAKHAGMSERKFREVFARTTGQSPKQFYDHLRLDASTELLRLGAHSVKEVAVRLGYSSPFHLSRAYRARFGMPPSKV